MKENELLQRTFHFGINCLMLLREFPASSEMTVIRYQLTKSATSVGANYEESQAGSSKADFRNKVRIALKEARESNYWLRVIKSLHSTDNERLDGLLKESDELKRILASILNKCRE